MRVQKSVTPETRQQLLEQALVSNFIDAELSQGSFPILVPDATHRAQVLHHAATLRVNKLLYVRGIYLSINEQRRSSLSALQIVSLITIPNLWIERYLLCLRSLSNELKLGDFFGQLENYPSTPESQIQPELLFNLGLFEKNGIANPNMSRLRDIHTICLGFKLGRLVRELSEPPPPCKKLIPQICALWNWTKSFSDSASRKKEDFKLKLKQVPK